MLRCRLIFLRQLQRTSFRKDKFEKFYSGMHDRDRVGEFSTNKPIAGSHTQGYVANDAVAI